MFTNDIIDGCASDLVGFRQSVNPCYTSLSASLKLSTSGLYVNDLPGVNFDFMQYIFSTDYGDITDTTSLNSYLLAVHQSCRYEILMDLVNRIKQQLETKELLSNFPIVSGVVSQANTVTQNGRFVGYRIIPHLSNNLKTELTHIGFQVNKILSSPVRIYLYATDQLSAIKTFDLSNTQTFSLEWQQMTDWLCNFQSTTGGSGQNYLLGYYEYDANNPQPVQLEATAKAYYLSFDCGCPTSGKHKWGQYVGIEPIELNNNLLQWDATSGEYLLPDSGDIGDYKTNQTYGLVAKINVTCDISQVLCANKNIWAKAYQYKMANRILMDGWASARINTQSEKKEQLKLLAAKYHAELYGYTDEGGIYHKGLLDNITFDFSNVDSYCLPCKQTKIFTGRIVRNNRNNQTPCNGC